MQLPLLAVKFDDVSVLVQNGDQHHAHCLTVVELVVFGLTVIELVVFGLTMIELVVFELTMIELAVLN